MRFFWIAVSLTLMVMLLATCGKQAKRNDKPSVRLPNTYLFESAQRVAGKGTPVSPKRTQPPVSRKLNSNLRKVIANPHIRQIEEPEQTILADQLPIREVGKNGWQKPIVLPAQGQSIEAMFPKPVPALQPSQKDDAVRDIQYLDTDQGLKFSYIIAILEDRRGDIWFGTEFGGVNRYDGQSFTYFTQKEGLSDFNLRSIIEDAAGNLWFGLGGGGICRFDGKVFTHFTEREGLSNNEVRTLMEDRSGNLWIGTDDGLNKFDGKQFTIYKTAQGLSMNRIESLLEAEDGNLWIGTWGGGLNHFDGQRFTEISINEGLPDDEISALLQDGEGDLWVGTKEGGLVHFDGRTFTTIGRRQGLKNSSISSLQEDGEGRLWIGTEGGGVASLNGRWLTQYTDQNGLTSNQVEALYADSSDNIWIGTWGGGVCKLNTKGFQHWTEGEGLSSNFVEAILEDREKNIWLGSRYNGLMRFDGESFTHITSADGLFGDIVYALMEDRQGNLWIGTEDSGLTKFDGTTFTNFNLDQGLADPAVNALLEDRNGNIWIGTNGGVQRFDGQQFTLFTTENGLGHNDIASLYEDEDGLIWIGTTDGFVHSYDGENLTQYKLGKGNGHNIVRTIKGDGKGNLWIAVEELGIYRRSNDYVQLYDESMGLTNNIIRSMIVDDDDRVWAFTERGANVLIPDVTSEDELFRIVSIGRSDGLKALDFTLNSTLIDANNQLWVGGGKCLSQLDLNQFEISNNRPAVRLTQVELNQQFIDFHTFQEADYEAALGIRSNWVGGVDPVAFYNYPKELRVPYQVNHITFHFAATDWAAPHKLRYSYKIDGLDQTWSSPNPEPKADYRNIPPGQYTLSVRSLDEAHSYSIATTYRLRVFPPWWRTNLAYWVYAVVGTGLLYLTYLLFKRRLELQNKLVLEQKEALHFKALDEFKSRFFTNLTHELRTPLTVILGMAQQIKDRPSKNLLPNLNLIINNGSRLLELINQMLDLSKLESNALKLNLVQKDIVVFLHQIVGSYQAYAANKNVMVRSQSTIDSLVMDHDPVQIQQILTNLLSNAIKFSDPGGLVLVKMNVREVEGQSWLQLVVADEGIGIEESSLPHLFDRFYQASNSTTAGVKGTGIGLAHTKELVQLMEGTIAADSKLGKGTTMTIELPIRNKVSKENATIDPAKLPDTDLDNTPVTSLTPIQTNVEDLPTILLIEDNLDIVTYLLSCFEDNYQVSVAYNGENGVQMALEHIPDLIVSDVMMPGMDGFQVCKLLKENERTSHIPIILLTARVDTASKLEGLQQGADAYLAKPFNRQELLVRLENMLELSRRIKVQMSKIARQKAAGNRANEKMDVNFSIEQAFLQKVLDIIAANYQDEHFALPQLCSKIGMSRSQLFRKMKALTDSSPSQFIRTYRLERAKQLLQSSDLSISEVSWQVGFKDPSHFSKSYQDQFGFTPSATRN